jgi:benzoate-CoA ligase family protein
MNLFQAIFERDSRTSPAIIFEQRRISYDELRQLTLTIAKTLAFLNVAKSARVAILLHDSPEFIEAFIAICSMGAIAVPINMALPLEEQRTILYDCGASLAIIESELCNTLLTGASEKLHHLKTIIVVARENTREKHEESTDTQGSQRWSTEKPVVHELQALIGEAASTGSPRFPSPGQNDPAFILYTSGSTGDPKGAVHRQADVFYTNKTFCQEVLHLSFSDRVFSSSRLPFAYGLGNSFSFPLLNGATTVLCREKPTAEVISRIFRDSKPTIFFGVPVIFNLLLELHRRDHSLDCSSLRLCLSAGEALPAQLGEECEKAFGVEILDGIGSTEMLHMFMSNHEKDVRYGSSGKVLEGYEARLLDEHDQPTAAGVEGNLWVRGASAALEYWQRPAETARTFVAGWVRTGDLYRRDAEGYWFHMGRSDDCFKSSGRWVSPVEVEGVLLRHTRAARAAVVEDFDDARLPCPCAFVVSQDVESDLIQLEKELRDLAAEALPRFKQPRKYVFVSELPYTATGKIQRFRLRQQLRKKNE